MRLRRGRAATAAVIVPGTDRLAGLRTGREAERRPGTTCSPAVVDRARERAATARGHLQCLRDPRPGMAAAGPGSGRLSAVTAETPLRRVSTVDPCCAGHTRSAPSATSSNSGGHGNSALCPSPAPGTWSGQVRAVAVVDTWCPATARAVRCSPGAWAAAPHVPMGATGTSVGQVTRRPAALSVSYAARSTPSPARWSSTMERTVVGSWIARR